MRSVILFARVSRSRRMGWAGHIVLMRNMKDVYKMLVIEKSEIYGDLDVDGRIILKGIVMIQSENSPVSGCGTVAGSCKRDNEPSGSIKYGELFLPTE
jgi:hypothetical protein